MLLLWFLIPALAVLVVAGVGLRVAVSLAAVRTSRRALAEIERAAREADGADEIVLVRGKLLIEGEGCNPPERGWKKRCAATASWSSERRLARKKGEHVGGERAERLMIESRDGLVELGGALEVRMGSALALDSGRVASSDQFLSRTALFDGDEVVAIGVRRSGSSSPMMAPFTTAIRPESPCSRPEKTGCPSSRRGSRARRYRSSHGSARSRYRRRCSLRSPRAASSPPPRAPPRASRAAPRAIAIGSSIRRTTPIAAPRSFA